LNISCYLILHISAVFVDRVAVAAAVCYEPVWYRLLHHSTDIH